MKWRVLRRRRVLFRVMRRSIMLRMLLGGIAALAAYVGMLWLIRELPGVDIRQPLAIGWSGTWWLGFVFSTWNTYARVRTVLSLYHGDPTAIYPSLRQGDVPLARRISASEVRRHTSRTLTCGCMTLAGLMSVGQIGSVELRTLLILMGGLLVVINAMMDAYDHALAGQVAEALNAPTLQGGGV